MNLRTLIPVSLVAAVVGTMVGAPIAGANPVSSQYDVPSVTTPATDTTNTSPVIKVSGKTDTVNNASTTTPKSANVTTAAPVPAVSASGTLPFTGLNMSLLVVIGGVAVASGLGLRQVAARRRPEDS